MNAVEAKDWTVNHRKVFTALGASNHSERKRPRHDYYATEPRAVELLLQEEQFAPLIWECACGEGHISKVLEQHGFKVISTDLVYRGFGNSRSINFLKEEFEDFKGDIITNPPYKYALEFVRRALDIVQSRRKVAMLLRLQFLEGKERKKFFLENPPKVIYVSSSRLSCAINGEFEKVGASAVAYAWFVWEKGFAGETVIRWIN